MTMLRLGEGQYCGLEKVNIKNTTEVNHYKATLQNKYFFRNTLLLEYTLIVVDTWCKLSQNLLAND